MGRYNAVGWAVAIAMIFALTSCAQKPHLSPKETVELYLNELRIIKDPIYKKAVRDELAQDKEKARRYVKAANTVNGLIWKDISSAHVKIRRNLLMAAPLILTYENYKIISEDIQGKKAFVTVVFGKTCVFGLDLGEASRRDSRPVKYELIKTDKGWQIKDIDGILAKRGF